MRELTLEELELVAGGTTSTGDIIVIGDRGGDGGGGGDFGDFGDYGDYGDGMGGGGGGDSGSQPPSSPITVTPDPTHHSATVSADIPGVDGTIHFNLGDSGLQSISFDLHDGNDMWTSSVNLTNGTVGETYTLNFGNGDSASLSFTTDGSNSGVSASLTYHF